MTWWFNTKLALANSVPAFTFSGQVAREMGRLSGVLRSYEYDSETVLKKRRESFKRMVLLAQTHADLKNMAVLREKYGDSAEYVREAEQYVKDVKQVLQLLKNVIEDEYLETVYDVHEAVGLFKGLIQPLEKVTRLKQLTKREAEELREEIAEFKSGFSEFIEEVMGLLENDLKLFGNMGIPLAEQLERRMRKEIVLTEQQDAALADHIVAKTEIMKNLRLKKKRVEELLRNIVRLMCKLDFFNSFKEKIGGLLDATEDFLTYSEDRVHLAFEIVRDAVLLQIQKGKELEEMTRELAVLKQQKVSGKALAALNAQVATLERTAQHLQRVEAQETKRTLRNVHGLRAAVLTAALVLTGMGAKLTDVVQSTQAQAVMLEQGRLPNRIPMSVYGTKGCAEFVRKVFENEWGINSITLDLSGIAGDAWTIYDQLMEKRGEVIFSVFPQIQAGHGAEIQRLRQDLKRYMGTDTKVTAQYAQRIRSFFPTEVKLPISKVKVGDIVGMYYRDSKYQVQAFSQGKSAFNTHVGVVVAIEGERILVAHEMNKKLVLSELRELQSVHNGVSSMVVWVVRAHFPTQFTADLVMRGGRG